VNEEFMKHLRYLTLKDLWKETLLLEKREPSEERNTKIKLLQTKAEFFQLINKLNKMQVETPEFIKQLDLVSFFQGDDLKENEKNIILLKNRFTKRTNSGQGARNTNSTRY